MGRICRVCGRKRPHEKFGGRGEPAVVCKDCRQLPKIERQRALMMQEVWGFLQQSNISAKNIARLEVIEQVDVEDVAKLAALVKDIALAKPHKKRRWRFLRNERPDLFQRAIDIGLLEPQEDWNESLGASPFDDDQDWDSDSGSLPV